MRPAAPVEDVGQSATGPGQAGRSVRVTEKALTTAHSLTSGSLGPVAVDQFGKVEEEVVVITCLIGALHLAELALEAGVKDPGRLVVGDPTDIAVVVVVDEREQ